MSMPTAVPTATANTIARPKRVVVPRPNTQSLIGALAAKRITAATSGPTLERMFFQPIVPVSARLEGSAAVPMAIVAAPASSRRNTSTAGLAKASCGRGANNPQPCFVWPFLAPVVLKARAVLAAVVVLVAPVALVVLVGRVVSVVLVAPVAPVARVVGNGWRFV